MVPDQKVIIHVEKHGPPPPKRTYEKKVVYPFGDIPIGMSARMPRTAATVREKMYEYLKTPEGKGKKFVIRPVTPSMCRIWRIK